MKCKFLNRITLSASAVAFAVAASGTQVFAQEGGEQTSFVLEELIVTARKRDESILEVPIAITAFGSQEIQSLGLEDISDIQLFTPGFVYEAFATTPGRFDQSPRFRGIDIDTGSPLRQTASVFVDGLFVVNGASGISLGDVERVEVIKGPQSALFGRNTFGGAINYISKTPGDEFAGRVTASIAEDDDYEVSVSLEGPLTDTLSGRINASYHDDGGHYSNSAVPGEDLGEEETTSVTASLFFEPSERFNAKLRVNYYENDDGGPAVSRSGQAEFNCGGFGGTDDLICGDLPFNNPPGLNSDFSGNAANFASLIQSPQLGSPRTELGFDRESLSISAQWTYNITDNIQLSSLTGYADETTNLLNDGDETSVNNFVAANAREFEMFTQELRLSGTAAEDRLTWGVGVNYFDQEFRSSGNFISPLGGFAFGDFNPNEEKVETVGVFGSLSYDFTDKLSVTLEARRQNDEITQDADIVDTIPAQNGDFDSTLPRFIIDYQLTPDTLVYASYSEGNLPGGFNGEILDLQNTNPAALAELAIIEPGAGTSFSEEDLESYEIGIKHGFADGKGSVSAALFTMERVGQIFRRSLGLVADGGQTTTFFINAGGSDIDGFEIEGEYQISPMFTLSGGIGYVDAEFTSFESGVFQEIFGRLDAVGSKSPRFPEWSGNLSLLAERDIASGMTWFGRIDANYIGERFTDEGNLTTVGSGTLVNLRTGVRTDRYRAEIFLKNATDDEVPTGAGRSRDLSLPGFSGFGIFGYRQGLRDRRQIGVRVSYDF